MLKKRVLFALIGFSATLLLALTLLPVHATAVVVQQNNGGCYGCSTSLSVSLASPVASGDVIVVGVVVADASFSVRSLTDSLGSVFTQAVTSTNAAPILVYVYVATLSTGGAEVVTATFSAAAPAQSMYIYEVSDVTTVGLATATGSGTGTSISTSRAVSFQTGAFLFAIIGTNSLGGTATAGPGFILSADDSVKGMVYAEYSISDVSSPASFQATCNSAVSWAEAAIALMPN